VAEINEPIGGDDVSPPTSYSKGSLEKDRRGHTSFMKLKGLSFLILKRCSIEFFNDYELKEKNVHIITHFDGRATRETFLEFLSAIDSRTL
jgi:hypothetical protein